MVPPKTTMLPPGSIRHAECAARPAGTLPAMSTGFLRVQRGASSPPCTSLHLPARATGPACVQPVHAARPRWQVHATRRGGGELGVPAAVAALRRGHFSRPGFAPRAVIVHVEPGVLVVDLRRALAPCRTPEEDDAPLDRRGRVESAAGGGRALAVGHLPPGPAGQFEHVGVAEPAITLGWVRFGCWRCVHGFRCHAHGVILPLAPKDDKPAAFVLADQRGRVTVRRRRGRPIRNLLLPGKHRRARRKAEPGGLSRRPAPARRAGSRSSEGRGWQRGNALQASK